MRLKTVFSDSLKPGKILLPSRAPFGPMELLFVDDMYASAEREVAGDHKLMLLKALQHIYKNLIFRG